MPYKIRVHVLVEPEEPEIYDTVDEALADKASMELMQPENKYEIVDLDTEEVIENSIQEKIYLTEMSLADLANGLEIHDSQVIIYPPKTKELISIILTSLYWDCECENDYIHSSSGDDNYCPNCGTYREDQPDSRIDEVIAAGLPL